MERETGGAVIKHRLLIGLVLAALLGSQSALALDLSNGRTLYQRHCVRCHGDDGRGVHPQAPDFRKLEGLLVSDRRLKEHIRMGKGGCPAFSGIIKESHLFDVVTYLRVFR